MASRSSRPELVVIVGETASGKSKLAYKLADEAGGEIINADSWSVYRDFDIGTSKPTKGQQEAVRHHLIDIADANDGFNAALFKQKAIKAIADIQSRGKLPILAGGTGLYIDSVVFDFGFLPNSKERPNLNKMSLSELLKLAEERAINLVGIDTRNKRRVIRAIESGGQKPSKKAITPGVLMVGLRLPREVLRQRVEERTRQMVDAGLENEAKRLAQEYGWDAEPMKGIGYQQWRAYFEGRQNWEQTIQRITSSTMNLAKRQRTWFKRNPHIRWFGSSEEAIEYIKGQLQP